MAEKASLVLLDFWAEWCGPCKMMHPIIEELKNEYTNKPVVREINVDEPEAGDLVSKYNIMSIPTYIFLKNDEAVDSVIGAQTKAVLRQKIDKLV